MVFYWLTDGRSKIWITYNVANDRPQSSVANRPTPNNFQHNVTLYNKRVYIPHWLFCRWHVVVIPGTFRNRFTDADIRYWRSLACWTDKHNGCSLSDRLCVRDSWNSCKYTASALPVPIWRQWRFLICISPSIRFLATVYCRIVSYQVHIDFDFAFAQLVTGRIAFIGPICHFTP